MAQSTTVLPTGTRAFQEVTANVTETTAIFVANADGGQLALKQVDGISAGAVTLRVYSVNSDNTTTPLATFITPTGNFTQTFRGGAFATPDEFLNQKISQKGAQNLGLYNAGGIRITTQAAGPLAISLGAALDRRIDGPIS